MLWLHTFSVLFMTGVIWLIQLVHYPLMVYVKPEEFPVFHAEHSRWITVVVGPMMLLQLGTSFLINSYLAVLFSVAVFAATFFVSVPLHNQLAGGLDPTVLQQLVRTNWIRTILWTLHSLWLAQMWLNARSVIQT